MAAQLDAENGVRCPTDPSVYRNELVNGKYCIVLLLSYQQGRTDGRRQTRAQT